MSEQSQRCSETNGECLISVSPRRTSHPSDRPMTHYVEHLGGVPRRPGVFAFPSLLRRDMALAELICKFRSLYFFAVPGFRERGVRRVLIAESDESLADDYGDVFSQHGFDVEMARDGLSCIQLLRLYRPHAVVLERELQWGGGEGVLAWMRADTRLSTTPVVMTISEESSGGLPSVVTAPVVASFRKPLQPVRLLETVVGHLSDQRIRSE